jgi:hypothetical protein
MKQLIWRIVAMSVGVGLVTGGVVVACTPQMPAPVASGTVVGFRFSGDAPHRCRLWIKPTGRTLRNRVLLDPNSESECVNARIGDRWERAR